MAKASKKNPGKAASSQASSYTERLGHGAREALLLLSAALTIYLLMALISYSAGDPGWSARGFIGSVENLGGRAGAWFADVLLSLLGYMGFVLPWLVLYYGWMVFRGGRDASFRGRSLLIRVISLVIFLLSGCAILDLVLGGATGALPQGQGGIAGSVIGAILVRGFNVFGALWLLFAFLVVSSSIGAGFSWLGIAERLGGWTINRWNAVLCRLSEWREMRAVAKASKPEIREPVSPKPIKPKKGKPPRKAPSLDTRREEQLPLPMDEDPIDVPAFNPAKDQPIPPLDLLEYSRNAGHAFSKSELDEMSQQVQDSLAHFGIEVTVVAVEPGPVITRFELDLAPGVKVSQVTNLAKDVARALSTASVRVVEVIPGKPYIGLEIPNQQPALVALREIFESPKYQQSGSSLTLALGKDISGNPVVADLARMPHLLVAGATGAGKSVAINVMILSLLYRVTARDVRIIMIDPKMLELSVYEGIPHLLAPVVTDMKEAANALRWCVAEMERRYKLMAAVGVRNLAGFNKKVSDAEASGRPIPDPLAKPEEGFEDEFEAPLLETLPQIVVIIDELADMMMVVGKKVEELIARIAQKARASGIHLILATQRPSVDVITGLIKANIPTRISFQVTSRVDSRTILDQMGAEALLGNGDMLFLPPGTALPKRVHGAFVDDPEVHKVVAWLKQTGEADYKEDILTTTIDAEPGGGGQAADAESDPLYDEAVQIVTESRKASISWVQRRLRIGYNRAARLVEQMEAAGVVGPLESNGAREVIAPPPPEV